MALTELAVKNSKPREKPYVFPGPRRKGEERPLSENGVRTALVALGYEKEMTPHGFRASARTLLEEELKFSIDLIEHQSARRVRDPLGRAYNRTQHLDARRDMMQAWGDYLDQLRVKSGGRAILKSRLAPEESSKRTMNIRTIGMQLNKPTGISC